MNRRVAIVLACTLLALAATGIVVPVGVERLEWHDEPIDPNNTSQWPPFTQPVLKRHDTPGWIGFRWEPIWKVDFRPPTGFYASVTLGVAVHEERVVVWRILALEWLAILAVGAAFAWRVRTRRSSDLPPPVSSLQPG